MEIKSRKDALAAGETYYFTGKPCPNGHLEVRFVSTYNCKTCAIEHHQRYRKTDPDFRERERAAKAAWRAIPENRQKDRDYAAKQWRENPLWRERNAAYKNKNREKINERQRVANMTVEQIAKLRAHTRRTYLKFRDELLVKAKVYRGLRKGAEGSFTKDDIDRIYKAQKGRCANCGKSLNKSKQLDHIHPVSKGGSNWPSNLQYLCAPCNSHKRAKDPIDWARENGRLL